jgi:hypothetical protein
MTLKIENLAIEAQQLSRITALYFRDLFEFVTSNPDIPITISLIGLIVAIALKNFNIDDITLPSIFLRFIGLTTFWGGLILLALGLVGAVLGIIFDLVLQRDSSVEFYKFYTVKFLINVKFPAVLGVLIGMMMFVFIKRIIEPLSNRAIQRVAKKRINVDSIPDVKNMQSVLPITRAYDARKYFKIAQKKRAVFLGIDSKNKPVYVLRKNWQQSNVQIIGVPGAGKGVSAAIQLYQSILNGDSCVIFNPKIDEWAESLYAEACLKVGKPLLVVDCRAGSPPQINPLLGINSYDLNELLVSTFNLSRQGEAADFYRNNDRKAARLLSKLADAGPVTIPALISHSHEILGDLYKQSEGLMTQLEEIGELSAIQTCEGIDLVEFIKSGGCLLIQGSTRDESVITLLNILLVRIIQIAENRADKNRHVSIFCDELKYLLTFVLVNTLGTARDKNINFILAHQTLADLEVTNAGFSPQAVKNAILSLTPIKWIYKCSDYDTAKWVSELCGTKTGVEEVIESTSNSLASENLSLSRRFHTTEIPNVHTNVIQNLPKFCAVCIGATDSGSVVAFTSPISVPKTRVPLRPATPLNQGDLEDELL